MLKSRKDTRYSLDDVVSTHDRSELAAMPVDLCEEVLPSNPSTYAHTPSPMRTDLIQLDVDIQHSESWARLEPVHCDFVIDPTAEVGRRFLPGISHSQRHRRQPHSKNGTFRHCQQHCANYNGRH